MAQDFAGRIAAAINNKIKPAGSLGTLEQVAAQLCAIQGTEHPVLNSPAIVVFMADHGISRQPVSAFPREVTAQMAWRLSAGDAAINVFARLNQLDLVVVDAGIDWPGERDRRLVDHWMGPGTASFLDGDAMTVDQVEACMAAGAATVDQEIDPNCNIVGFGELGIGNTSASSLLISALLPLPLSDCVGSGTGLTGPGLERKYQLLKQAQEAHPQPTSAKHAMAMFGGFEIAQMAGGMKRAWERGLTVMVDGFTASAAFLSVWADQPGILDNAIFCHQSAERGHAWVLGQLGARPLLHLGMHLGEGTGCALAYPLIAAAASFVNEMATFDQAGVDNCRIV